MAETPLDRLKLLASWVAFINATSLAYALLIVTVASSVGEQSDSSGFELIYLYWDLVGGWLFATSPVIWGVLNITTGSPRFLPWKHK